MESFVFKSIFFLILLTTSLSGCGSTHYRESTGQYVDSAAVTTKVKTRLFDMLGSSAFPIKVKTYKNTVQLSGFVDSETIKQRAGFIAYNTIGVKSIKNDLIVK